jgi:ankyrin repeat protein
LGSSFVIFLIGAGAEFNDEGIEVFVACYKGHVEILRFLINSGVSIKLETVGKMSPLMIACKSNHKEIVRLLIEAGANVNEKDNNGNVPLVYACDGGNAEIVKS